MSFIMTICFMNHVSEIIIQMNKSLCPAEGGIGSSVMFWMSNSNFQRRSGINRKPGIHFELIFSSYATVEALKRTHTHTHNELPHRCDHVFGVLCLCVVSSNTFIITAPHWALGEVKDAYAYQRAAAELNPHHLSTVWLHVGWRAPKSPQCLSNGLVRS